MHRRPQGRLRAKRYQATSVAHVARGRRGYRRVRRQYGGVIVDVTRAASLWRAERSIFARVFSPKSRASTATAQSGIFNNHSPEPGAGPDPVSGSALAPHLAGLDSARVSVGINVDISGHPSAAE